MINKIKWQTQNFLLQAIGIRNLFLKKYTPNDFIWINGSGRSGTTWLGELLTTIPNSKLIDEPLKRTNSKYLQKINLKGIQYIPQRNADWNEFNVYMDRFFKGAQFNPNHFHLNIKSTSSTKIWIVKEIRSHLMLPWLIDRYSLNKVINIIRNPFNVIASQKNHSSWSTNKWVFNFDEFKYGTFYKQYESIYNAINNKVDYMAFEWCLQNSYLLNHKYNNKKWLNVIYEELYLEPEKTLLKIFNFLDIKISNEVYDIIDIKSFSSKTINQDELKNKEKHLNKFKKTLNVNEIKTINNYLDLFKIENVWI